MHESVMAWVGKKVKDLDLTKARPKVLEVGSYNENGSVKNYFIGSRYVGVDMREGPGVDQVVDGHWLDAYFGKGEFDVVVCTEVLEHDSAYWVTLANIGTVLREGGYLFLTTRGNGFPHHAYPNDYWRFMPDSVPLLMDLACCETVEFVPDPQHPGIMVLGRRI